MTQAEFIKQVTGLLYMEPQDIRESFVGFLLHRRKAVHELRQLATTWDSLMPIVQRLIQDRYHHYPGRWKGAAEWIDRGQWQFKTPKALTYPDFYPTPEQMGQIGAQFMHVDDVRRQTKAAYERGKADATVYATATRTAMPVSKEERMAEWNVLKQAFENRAEWEKRITELERELVTVQRERDKLMIQNATKTTTGPLFTEAMS
jgi:hypothetical protein